MSSQFQLETWRVASSGHWFMATAGEAISDRDAVRLGTNGRIYQADADAAATMPCIGIAITAAIIAGANVSVLISGFVEIPGNVWTPGARLYVSTAPGALTHTAPSGVGDIIQEVGFAMNTTQIYLNPQGEEAVGAGPDLRPMFFPAVNPDGYTGTHAGERMQDGQDVTCRIEFLLPTDYTSSWRVDVLVIPEGTGNLRRAVATNFGAVCANEGKATHTDTIAAGVVAVTDDEIECITVDAALTGAAALDLVGLEFTRSASNAADTVNADVYFIGVIIREPV